MTYEGNKALVPYEEIVRFVTAGKLLQPDTDYNIIIIVYKLYVPIIEDDYYVIIFLLLLWTLNWFGKKRQLISWATLLVKNRLNVGII